MTRGQRGRELARAELAMAVAVVVVIGFLFISAPSYMGGGPPPWETPLFLIALAGLVFGLAWMIRIYRAEPEPDQHMWRYRS